MESAEAQGKGEQNLNPSRHKHELYWEEGLPRYTCKGCKQYGANKGYKCSSCAKVILHEVCANSPDEGVHNRVHLKFRRRTILSHSCDACRESIKGFVFESSSRDMRLHPLCMMLPETFIYSGHKEHTLKLVRETEGKYICLQCSNQHQVWRYRCVETTCRVILDLDCSIIDIHDQSGIIKVGRASRLKPVMRNSAAVTGAVVKGTLQGFGLG